MSTAIHEVRAMLALFGRSPWRDLHARTGAWEIFLARAGGAANPMTAVPPAAAAVEQVITTVDAPYLGLFFAHVATGDIVGNGEAIGQIEVLGEREDVCAKHDGRVSAVLIGDGELVEYAVPLVQLTV